MSNNKDEVRCIGNLKVYPADLTTQQHADALAHGIRCQVNEIHELVIKEKINWPKMQLEVRMTLEPDYGSKVRDLYHRIHMNASKMYEILQEVVEEEESLVVFTGETAVNDASKLIWKIKNGE